MMNRISRWHTSIALSGTTPSSSRLRHLYTAAGWGLLLPSRCLFLPCLFLLCLFLLCFPSPCYAYIDPGSGSMLLQALLAGIVGALFTIKMYWRECKRFIGRMLGRQDAGQERPEDDTNKKDDSDPQAPK
jgi:hypothetical protein